MKAVSSPLVEPDAAPVENMDRADDPAGRRSQWALWAAALRLHQWVKNVLLVVPLLLAHEFTMRQCVDVALGFLIFGIVRSEEHTSELQSLMRISYAVFCLQKKQTDKQHNNNNDQHKPTKTIL